MTHWGILRMLKMVLCETKCISYRATRRRMGNAQARKRIKASDFDYLAKNTNFLTLEVRRLLESNGSEVFPVIKDRIYYSLFSTDCRWQRVTLQRSARGVREVWWIRPTSWRSSILLFLQGSYIISDGYFTELLRPEDRVNKLSEQLANTEGKIGDLKILLIR